MLQQFTFPTNSSQIPFSPHPWQHLLLLIFSVIVTLTGVRQYLTVILICVSLMTSDAEHLFMYLLAICMSSLKKCLHISWKYQITTSDATMILSWYIHQAIINTLLDLITNNHSRKSLLCERIQENNYLWRREVIYKSCSGCERSCKKEF